MSRNISNGICTFIFKLDKQYLTNEQNLTHWAEKVGVEALPIMINEELQEIYELDTEVRRNMTKKKSGIEKIKSLIKELFYPTMMHKFIDLQRAILRFVLEQNENGKYQPDIIVTEKICPLCVDAAEAIGVPYVHFHPSMIIGEGAHYVPSPGAAYPLEMNFKQRIITHLTAFIPGRAILNYFMYDIINDIRVSYGIAEKVHQRFSYDRDDRYIMVNTCFGFEYSRPLLPLTKLVGPMIPPKLNDIPSNLADWMIADQSDVIYMCMGTVATITSEMASKLLQALGTMEYRILWSLPLNQRDILEGIDIPSNVKLESFVPQREILLHPKVKLFISHTGASSATEAMLAKVPVVCMPFFGDQPEYCSKIVSAKAGLQLDKDNLDVDDISHKVTSVLTEEIFRTSATKVSAALQCGGTQVAADIVFDMYENGCEHLIPANQKLEGFQRGGWDVIFFEWILVILIFVSFIISLLCCKCCCCWVFQRRSTKKLKTQ